MAPILAFKHLSKTVQGNSARKLLADLSADIYSKDKIAIVGASGQGKSTLLRILALLEQADSGQMTYKGILSTQWKAREWRSHICYLMQQAYMLEGTVENNLSIVSRMHNREFERELAAELLAKLGLETMDWQKDASTLSGGEKQRIALVRGLLLRPKVLLLDEPTASLDTNSKRMVEDLLNEWNRKEGTAIIWITHDPEQVERVADRVWCLQKGQLLETSRRGSSSPNVMQ